MKKYCKIYIFFIFFILFSSKTFALSGEVKDFCNTGQSYHFDCKDVEIQCTYLDGIYKLYLNINKSHSMATYSIEDGPKSSITNWGRSASVFSDAKNTYKRTQECPATVVQHVQDFYMSYNDEYKNYGNLDEFSIYTLNNITRNSRVYNMVDENNEIDESAPDVDNCAGFREPDECKNGATKNAGKFGCAWNGDYNFCSPTGLAYLSCGSEGSIAYDIPVMVPRLSSYAITALKTITPVILIIIGMFQLIKAIASQNEDEMKKARSSLIKKLIAAAIIFFLVAIVQFIVKQVADDSEQSSTEACLDCLINNNCVNTMYYNDGYGKCYAVSNDKEIKCPVDKY